MLWLDCAGARVQQVRLPVRRDEDLPPEDQSGGLLQLQRDGEQQQPPGPGRGEDQGHPGPDRLQPGRHDWPEEVRRATTRMGRSLPWQWL